MIYSQAIGREQFQPALAIFKTTGFIPTTAGLQEIQNTAPELHTLPRVSNRSRFTPIQVLWRLIPLFI
ncbi:unnamed protein product [Thelazia callipaeda]|uniref:Transposase n=1 Tax=Thelazia callipaeda TaxID=103827 RepID=A0A0N5CNU7_THECL|nr:unnamed protein product [Thelazia callipaeda]